MQGIPIVLDPFFGNEKLKILWKILKFSKTFIHFRRCSFVTIYYVDARMVRAKPQVSKRQNIKPFQYNEMHDVYLGTTNPVPSQKQSVSIAENTVKVPRYGIQVHNVYRTFETKHQWIIMLSLRCLNNRVSEKKEWPPASKETQQRPYVPQNKI